MTHFFDGKIAYSRYGNGEKLLVICSFADHDTALKIPAGFDIARGELILGNYAGSSNTLRPYETRIYLWKA